MSHIGMKIAIGVLCCLLFPLISSAEPTYDDFGDLIRPDAKKNSGILEEIGPKIDGVVSTLVINDTNFSVDNQTFYRDANGRKSSLVRFKPGTLVDYYAIEYLVTNLSVAANSEEPASAENSRRDQSTPAPVQNELRQEDGVWKN